MKSRALEFFTQPVPVCASAVCLCILLFALPVNARSSAGQVPEFEDRPLDEPIVHPDWFKLSFLDLREDLKDALTAGRRGLIVYFGQERCPYCKALLDINWGRKDIVAYTRKYFDVVAIDVRGRKPVIDIDGVEYDEKQFAAKYKTNFTPSLLFYDRDGSTALKLTGYYPPYKFRAALEYVADGHYQKESFRTYLARAERAISFGRDELNRHEAFAPPPYALDRSSFPAGSPLVVFFEQRQCHACDVLHAGPLSDREITRSLKRMEAVRLDMGSDVPVVTPRGRRLTARQWAEELGLFYAPTLIFFDEHGREIIRIDSVVWVYRLGNVLQYVLTKGYLEYPNFQLWRRANRE